MQLLQAFDDGKSEARAFLHWGYVVAALAEALENRSRSSGLIPQPVSATSMNGQPWASTPVRTRTSPPGA